MKVFSSIMALYMMVLFIIPCADMYEKDINHNHSIEISYQHIRNHTETQDSCTPFCVCGCCGMVSGVVLQWNAFDFNEILSFDISKPKIYYKSVFISLYFGEIWQPPKINA